MAYQKIGFKNGNVLTAEQLIHMEDGIINAEKKIPSGGGASLPDAGPYQQLVTDGEGKWGTADRLAWKTLQKGSELIPETNLSFTAQSGLMAGDAPLDTLLVAGEKYVVNWDGKEYVSTCQTASEGFPILGNYSLYDPAMDNTGEPFCAVQLFTLIFYTPDEAATHTVGLSAMSEAVRTVPPEYLPEGIGWSEVETTTVEWDGSMEDPENIGYQEGQFFLYWVSPHVFTEEELKAGIFYGSDGGKTAAERMWEDGREQGDGYIGFGGYAIFTTRDNVTDQYGGVYKKAGVYLCKNPNYYISKFEVVFEDVRKIPKKFIDLPDDAVKYVRIDLDEGITKLSDLEAVDGHTYFKVVEGHYAYTGMLNYDGDRYSYDLLGYNGFRTYYLTFDENGVLSNVEKSYETYFCMTDANGVNYRIQVDTDGTLKAYTGGTMP